MSILARFRVNSVHPYGHSTAVSLSPVYSAEGVVEDAELAEVRRFYEATPNGQLTMTIRNEAAEEQFQVGDEYYVKLEKIPTERTVAALLQAKHA